MIMRQVSGFDGLHVIQDQTHSGRQHFDGAVLSQKVFRDFGLGRSFSRRDSSNVVKTNAFSLDGFQVFKLSLPTFEGKLTSSVAKL